MSKPKPLLVDIQGGDRASALMTEKAFLKSLETGTLWVYHPLNGRVIPYEGEPNHVALQKTSSYYYVMLPEGSSGYPYLDDVIETDEDVEDHPEVELKSTPEATPDPSQGSIIYRLSHIIAQRHKEMPVGSYTTHLFEKGPSKIRKKVGEEAIELVLAQKAEDIIYESADLLYHMLVMFEAEGISVDDLFNELERRDDTK